MLRTHASPLEKKPSQIVTRSKVANLTQSTAPVPPTVQAKSNEEGLAEWAAQLQKWDRLGTPWMDKAPNLSGELVQPWIQQKVTLSPPRDIHQQEVDRGAKKAVQPIHSPVCNNSSNALSGKPVQQKPIDTNITQRFSPVEGGEISADLEASIQQARSSGRPLDTNIRRSMEQSFGADFSNVRVHTDSQADRFNRDLHSRAFTTKEDLFFKQGEYQPGNTDGQTLLAHELTHVLQQKGTSLQTGNSIQRDDEKPNKLSEKEKYNEKQNKKINEYRNKKGELHSKDLISKLKGGFLGDMESKMVGIVKDVQDKEGSIQQADNYIHGDAAVNAFLLQKLLESKEKKDQQIVDTFATQVLTEKYRKSLLFNDKLDGSFVLSNKNKSLETARVSKKRVEDTAGDRVIIEMYYNQIEKLRKGKHTQKNKEKAADIYKFTKNRQFDITKRAEAQKKERNKLEDEGRISTTLVRALQATQHAVYGTVLKVLTLGFVTTKKNRDKRGWVSDKDFTLDLETGTAVEEELNSKKRNFDFQSPWEKILEIVNEYKSKVADRKGLGKAKLFSTLSLGCEVLKRFLGLVQGVFTSAALWAAGLSLIPGAQILAVMAAFCSTVSYYLGLIMTSISSLRTMLDGLVQLLNKNPLLFAQLSGETLKSGLNTVTESLAYGTGTLANFGREQITGQNRFDTEGIYDPKSTFNNHKDLNTSQGPDTFSSKGLGDKSVVGSTVGVGSGIMGINAGGTAGIQSTDDNDMTYTQTVNKNRRIGKKSKMTSNTSNKELQSILEAYETTKEKAQKTGAEFTKAVVKLSSEKPPKSNVKKNTEIPKDDSENLKRLPLISKLKNEVLGDFKDGIEELGKA